MITSMMAARRPIPRLDIVLTLALGVATLVFMVNQSHNETRDVSIVAAPAALFVIAPLTWRRAAPIAAIGAALAALCVFALLFAGGGLVACFFTMPMVLFFAYSAGTELPRRDSRIALGLTVAFALALCLTDGPEGADPSTIPF